MESGQSVSWYRATLANGWEGEREGRRGGVRDVVVMGPWEMGQLVQGGRPWSSGRLVAAIMRQSRLVCLCTLGCSSTRHPKESLARCDVAQVNVPPRCVCVCACSPFFFSLVVSTADMRGRGAVSMSLPHGVGRDRGGGGDIISLG